MSDGKNRLPTEARSAEVEQFLDKLKKAPFAHPGGGRGRLIFALDATASREPARPWNAPIACIRRSRARE